MGDIIQHTDILLQARFEIHFKLLTYSLLRYVWIVNDLNNRMFHSLYSYIVFECLWQWHVHWYGIYLVVIYLNCNSVVSWIFLFMYYPMTSSISNGLVALYGSDERIINNNNNNNNIYSVMADNYFSCNIPCAESCPPCNRKCTYTCKHSRCSRKCGQPCIHCKVRVSTCFIF